MKDCYHNEEYSMVLRMIISEKWIHINSYDVCFNYNVKSVIILKQKNKCYVQNKRQSY